MASSAFLVLVMAVLIFLFGWHCPFKWLTGIPCPGCGMTRALESLIHLDWKESLYWNAMLVPSLVMIPAALIVRPKSRKWCQGILMAWCVLMILYWIYRILFVFGSDPAFQVHGLLEELFSNL